MARRPFVPFGWRIEARAGYDELSQADDGDSHARMSKIAEEGAVDLDYGSFKVITYKLEPANKKGENYASLIYRIKIMVENSINALKEHLMDVNTTLRLARTSHIAQNILLNAGTTGLDGTKAHTVASCEICEKSNIKPDTRVIYRQQT